MMAPSRPTSRYSNRQQPQATTNGMTNARLSKQLPMQPPPVDDNFNHAADPTARSSITSVCTDPRERLSTMSCSALPAASGYSAAAADVCPAAGRTGRRSSSAASSTSEDGNLENASACCAAVADDPLIAAPYCRCVLRFGPSPAHHINLHPFRKALTPMLRQRSRTPQPTTVVVPCFGVSAVVGGSFIIGNAKHSHRNQGR